MEADDPLVRELRDQITANDKAIIEAYNTRLELVARLKRHKDELGLEFIDEQREALLYLELADANRGPLSGDGLAQLVSTLLSLTKQELAREP